MVRLSDIEEHDVSIDEIISKFPGHLYWKDRDGRYLGVNNEQLKSLGLNSPSDIIGKTDFDFVWKEQAQRLRDIDLEVMETDIPYSVEELVDTTQGKKRTFLSKKLPLRNDAGVIVGIIGTSVDITDQIETQKALEKARQKAERANRAKSEFIANMSHDLRTPLSGIQSLVEDIINKTTDTNIIDDARLLQNASGDLLYLIDNILEVIRTDAGQLIYEKKQFNLKHLVNNIVNMMQPKINEKQLSISINYDEAIPDDVIGSSLLLQRIIMNLLSNAIKFTDLDGQIGLTLCCLSLKDRRMLLQFTITDTGIGIPADKMEFIFEKFGRISASYVGAYKGAGVGLYMVKRYIEEMGGTMTVSSNEGEGSSFSFEVPLEVMKLSDKFYEDAQQTQEQLQKNFKGVTILLVEDNLIAQRSQSNKFRDLGCEVVVAGNGKEAQAIFAAQQFDFIVLDLGLPDIDGRVLAERFRLDHLNPNSLVPIVFLTAHDTAGNTKAEELGGLTVFRRKPLLAQDAKELLDTYLV